MLDCNRLVYLLRYYPDSMRPIKNLWTFALNVSRETFL